MVAGEENYLFFVMFWTILAMMLVLIYSLKQILVTQKHIQNMDKNIEKLVLKVLHDEERLISDVEKPKRGR